MYNVYNVYNVERKNPFVKGISRTKWEIFGKKWEIFGKKWEIFGKKWEIFGKKWEIFGKKWDTTELVSRLSDYSTSDNDNPKIVKIRWEIFGKKMGYYLTCIPFEGKIPERKGKEVVSVGG